MSVIHRSWLGMPVWSFGVPIAAFAVLVLALALPLGWMLLPLTAIALIGAVLVGVHHAEIIAVRVGEPFGTLILALAVTLIEVALIGSITLSGTPAAATLARDTVFATVMIVCNGVVGLCLLLGAIRHHVLVFRVEGTSQALSVLVALTTITLVLPTLTTTTPGPTYSPAQLAFAGVMSLLLYGVFVFVQAVRHRDYFLPLGFEVDAHHAVPSARVALASLGLLLVALVAVVGLAKILAPTIEAGVEAASAPPAVVGVAIALLILLPETISALRAAVRNRMQTSLNLALGSALATIGLTVPTVAVLSVLVGIPLELGLPHKETALLAVTLLLSTITLAGGSSTVLHGAVHLVVFGAFLVVEIVP